LHSRRRSRFRSDVPKPWVRAGRLLLVINVIVLILSGFTEHLWTWDRFLRGGQDFELSLLALIAFFCLILVLAQYFRRRFSELFDRRDGSSFERDLSALPSTASPSLPIFSSDRPPGLCVFVDLCSVILRI
jgi:hypothetical protein